MAGLQGRVALVTGGGRGVGRAISLGLAADGAAVAVNYRADADAAASVVEEIRSAGGDAEAFAAAVGDDTACDEMVAAVVERFGHVDLLVNNAGIASRGRSVLRTDPEELERVVRVHALGPHRVCAAVLPSMRERPRGDIVFISSVATQHLAAGGAPYNMGKAAMEALAFTLAKEEVRHGIRVNVVAPGLVDTDMGQRLMRAVAGVEGLRAIDATMPMGRVCTPEDVAGVVRFLVSDAAGYVTGQKVNVDGGA